MVAYHPADGDEELRGGDAELGLAGIVPRGRRLWWADAAQHGVKQADKHNNIFLPETIIRVVGQPLHLHRDDDALVELLLAPGDAGAQGALCRAALAGLQAGIEGLLVNVLVEEGLFGKRGRGAAGAALGLLVAVEPVGQALVGDQVDGGVIVPHVDEAGAVADAAGDDVPDAAVDDALLHLVVRAPSCRRRAW